MAKTRLPPIGFWSYVRRDDERLGHKISELRELVLAELETQIGGDVPVFKDTVSIPNGERWEALTVKALDDATFFIPILTPAFLRSEWCCREVRLFLDREQALFAAHPDLPRRSRIFPIHYVEVEEDADTADEAIRDTLMQLQHFSFQKKRNLRYDEPEVRDFISGFVADIRNLLKARVEEQEPPPVPPPPPPPKTRPKATPRPSVPVTPPPPPPPPPPRRNADPADEGDNERAAARAAAALSDEQLRKTALWVAGILAVILIFAVIVGLASQSPYGSNTANYVGNYLESANVYDPCAAGNTPECTDSMTANAPTALYNTPADNGPADAYGNGAAPADNSGYYVSNTVGM